MTLYRKMLSQTYNTTQYDTMRLILYKPNTNMFYCIKPNNAVTCTLQAFNYCTSRPDVCQCLVVQTPIENKPRNTPSTPMTHEACELKLLSVVRSCMHQGPGNWVAIGHVVVYNALAAQTISTGIKYRHCRVDVK